MKNYDAEPEKAQRHMFSRNLHEKCGRFESLEAI